jgi:hypothetical protein
MSKLIQIFLNADLRCSHDGLSKLARDNNIKVEDLLPGEFVLFINSNMNRLKLYTANQVLAYLRLKTGRIDLRAIQLIPQSFQASGKLQYDEALKEVIEKHMGRKK